MSDVGLTADQKRALFEQHDKAKAKVLTASGQLDAVVKTIHESLGAGPFKWQGVELSIAKRGERFVMRAKGQSVEEIG